MPVYKVRFLRYTRSQNDHPEDNVGAHIFRTSQSLNSNFLGQTLEFMDRFYFVSV
jgi:hypothetical protein